MQPFDGVSADTELGSLFVERSGNILAEPAFFFFSQYAATHPVSPCFVSVKIVYTICGKQAKKRNALMRVEL
jgi:hypothetical protein